MHRHCPFGDDRQARSRMLLGLEACMCGTQNRAVTALSKCVAEQKRTVSGMGGALTMRRRGRRSSQNYRYYIRLPVSVEVCFRSEKRSKKGAHPIIRARTWC